MDRPWGEHAERLNVCTAGACSFGVGVALGCMLCFFSSSGVRLYPFPVMILIPYTVSRGVPISNGISYDFGLPEC